MHPELPAPIAAYFEGNARLDVDAMLAPFAPEARVGDEARAHQGQKAIRAWIQEASIGNRAVAVPQGIVADGAGHLVTAEVSGPFPGSPVTLGFRFRLEGDRIASLEIG